MTIQDLNYQIMAVPGDAQIYVQVLSPANMDLNPSKSKVLTSTRWDRHNAMLIMSTAISHSVQVPHGSLANTCGDDKALSPPRRVVHGTLAETSLGESGPQLAGVRASGQGQVSVDDGVTGRDEGWVARLPAR